MRYIIGLSLLCLISCSSMKKQAKGKTAKLAGTSWTMQKISNFEMEKTRKPVTLAFEDSADRYGGNSGCNGFGGHYSVSGNTIKLDPAMATKMACFEGMKTENKFFNILSATDHYAITGDKLTLLKGKETLAEFVRNKKIQK